MMDSLERRQTELGIGIEQEKGRTDGAELLRRRPEIRVKDKLRGNEGFQEQTNVRPFEKKNNY